MKRKRNSCLTPFIIILLGAGCFLFLGALLALDFLPRLAAADFGNPAPGLDRFQKAIYAFQLILQKDALTKPRNANGAPQTIEISQGESVNSIALDLENAGIIQDAGSFRIYLIYSGLDKGIQAGKHLLSSSQTGLEIAQAIQDANPKVVSVHVLAGWREEEIAAALPANGLSISADDFLQTASLLKGDSILPGFSELKSVQGYLLPDAYSFKREATSGEILVAMLQNFDQQVTQEIRDGFKRQGLSLPEAVTLASMVQKEAVVADEMPIIASVFYNRLNDGMKLDSDPTVQFSLGYNPDLKTWWKNPLNASDLKVNSPYNTYANIGLPPSPICSPGLAALRSVAFPAQTPYYYFRARCDGSGRHNFAATYAEHIKNACNQ